MTWSTVARDADGRFGLAVASRFFAAGALCIHSRAGVGAVATQALVNPLDAGAAQRQLHLWGASGAGAAHTGGEWQGWHGRPAGRRHRPGGDRSPRRRFSRCSRCASEGDDTVKLHDDRIDRPRPASAP